jgi:hypothetical protein
VKEWTGGTNPYFGFTTNTESLDIGAAKLIPKGGISFNQADMPLGDDFTLTIENGDTRTISQSIGLGERSKIIVNGTLNVDMSEMSIADTQELIVNGTGTVNIPNGKKLAFAAGSKLTTDGSAKIEVNGTLELTADMAAVAHYGTVTVKSGGTIHDKSSGQLWGGDNSPTTGTLTVEYGGTGKVGTPETVLIGATGMVQLQAALGPSIPAFVSVQSGGRGALYYTLKGKALLTSNFEFANKLTLLDDAELVIQNEKTLRLASTVTNVNLGARSKITVQNGGTFLDERTFATGDHYLSPTPGKDFGSGAFVVEKGGLVKVGTTPTIIIGTNDNSGRLNLTETDGSFTITSSGYTLVKAATLKDDLTLGKPFTLDPGTTLTIDTSKTLTVNSTSPTYLRGMASDSKITLSSGARISWNDNPNPPTVSNWKWEGGVASTGTWVNGE